MASQVESAKRIPGTDFIVDGFRFQSPACRHYFLTHAHSDHTTGLGRSFAGGFIYCTPITAALLRQEMGLPHHLLRPLALDEAVTIEGVEVTPIDANHCPGACMFLFRVPPRGNATGAGSEPQCILHTGDLRWHPCMADHPALHAATPLHLLLLDTTYCAPKWVFPPQEEAVSLLVELMKREAAAHPATLFVVGSYHIGKERAYLGAAHQLGWRVHCTPSKRKVLRLLGLPAEWLALLTANPREARVHVLGMGEQLHEQALADRIRGSKWERVVAIRPTGWSFRKSGQLSVQEFGQVVTVGLPYSEHSSFPELRACVKALKPKKIVPTVNASDPAKARALVDLLCDCTALCADRSRLDSYFRRSAPGSAEQQQRRQQQHGVEALAGRECDATGEGSPTRSVWDLFATAPRGQGGDGKASSPIKGLPPELTSPARPAPRPPSRGVGPGPERAACPAGPAAASSQQRLCSLFKPASGPAELDAPSPTLSRSVASLAAAAIHGSRQSGAWHAVSTAVALPAAPGLPPQAAAREVDAAAGPRAACSGGEGSAGPGASGPPLPAAGAVQSSSDIGGSCGGGCNSTPAPPQEGPFQEGPGPLEGSPREGPPQECHHQQDEETVDLSQVDVREQERILAAIAAARRSPASPGSGGGAGAAGRRTNGGGGGTGTKLKQGSLRAFLAAQRP